MPILRTAQPKRLHHLYCDRCTNARPASLPVALPASAEANPGNQHLYQRVVPKVRN